MKPTTALLDPSDLESLFVELELWEKIEDGRRDTLEIVGSVAASECGGGSCMRDAPDHRSNRGVRPLG